jgi:catechol 2,3-dioxygenase-like lactoylglutathione lyase family enzyme
MFDHLKIVVRDLAGSRVFYSACLEPLGLRLLEDHSQSSREGWLVYGPPSRSSFLVVAAGRPSYWNSSHQASESPIHLALSAESTAAVDAFHRAGLASGGRDNGAPGSRGPSGKYYAAFLIDPDGNNLEVGCRER